MKDQTTKPGMRISPATYLIVAAVAFSVGFAAIYVTLGGGDNGSAPAVSTAAPPAGEAKTEGASAKLNSGEMAAFVFAKPKPATLGDVSFIDGEGKPKLLADFRGKAVLLNLWATWCAPCRKEMPALDRLQKELGSDKFEVVALAVDRAGLEGARDFLNGIKVETLRLYADPTAKAGGQLRVVGLPTTLLLDAQGREVGRLVGPAEWDSAEAKRLIQSVIR